MTPRFLNTKQVMEVVGVRARSTIYKWMKDGQFPQPTRRWGQPRWDSEEVHKAIRSDYSDSKTTITIMVENDSDEDVCVVKRA